MEAEDYYFANEYCQGISVRDKLSESAMTGLLTNVGTKEGYIADIIAKNAYEIADSMIKQSQIKP